MLSYRQDPVMANDNAVRDVHLFVLDTLADWEPAYATAHINAPAPGYPSRYRVRSAGLGLKPIRTRAGLGVTPDVDLSSVRPRDSAMLILPGADLWAEPAVEPALAKAREFLDAGVPVAAICGATFGLARAGLLDDRRHTSNDAGFLASSGYRGGAHYVDEPAVEDRGVITASSMAALDFARLILGRLEVFSKPALDAWYGLYQTRAPACYYAFVQALEESQASPQPGR
jgi:putative intracellular protease/amidase